MFTSYIEVGMDKALQIYNPNQYSVRFEDYAFFILQYASGSTVGNFRSLRRPISDDERITIPSGQTVALVSSPSAKITPYIPNTNFYGVSLGSFFKFTGNDPVFLAEFKEGDTDEAVDSGEIGVIFDVVGDTSTTGPWSSGDVSTDQQAIVRKSSVVMSGNLGTWEYTGTGGAQYSWDATEWETKLVEGSGEGGIDATNADLTFLGYHYQETFEVRRSEKTSSDAADVDLYSYLTLYLRSTPLSARATTSAPSILSLSSKTDSVTKIRAANGVSTALRTLTLMGELVLKNAQRSAAGKSQRPPAQIAETRRLSSPPHSSSPSTSQEINPATSLQPPSM